jgi:catalase
MNDQSQRPPLAHASGTPVTDNFNIQSAGPRGPALLQDVWLIEKLAHFAREVIAERRTHAEGSGAHGTVTHDITRYTKAMIFSEIGKQTPMFARFSTVAGERGAADAERDIRGFALKFYTEEGNWDVVGNNTPVFFFRDPLRFPDFELNRNPENVFAEVEQAAFSPANIAPGISYSPDKMLQGRLFSYGDAQRYRLGVNHHHIPVNAPKCPFHSYHRAGAMRTDGNLGGTATYFPNSRGEWIDQPQLNEPPLELEGATAHWDHRVNDDHYQQPGDRFRKMTPALEQMLFDNTARQVGAAARHIQERHVANCAEADPAYGAGIAKALGIDLKSKMIAAE